MTYLHTLWIAFDNFINAIFGGESDETVSSRCWRISPVMTKCINCIVFWQKNHCLSAYEKYVKRKTTAPLIPEKQ